MSDIRRRVGEIEDRLPSGATARPAPPRKPMTAADITGELNVLADAGVIPRLGGTATRGDVEQEGRIGELVRGLIDANVLHPPPDLDDELRALLRP